MRTEGQNRARRPTRGGGAVARTLGASGWARLLIAEKQKLHYDPLHAGIGRSATGSTPSRTGTGPFAREPDDEENSGRKDFVKLACNALKSHDSRVNKRAKPSSERLSNAG